MYMCSSIWNNVKSTDATKKEYIKQVVTLLGIDFLNISYSYTFELLNVRVLRFRKYRPDCFCVSLDGNKHLL